MNNKFIGFAVIFAAVIVAFLTLKGYYPVSDEWIEPYTAQENWITRPFYNVMGMWPVFFNNEPVFVSIPYVKGPPKQFLQTIEIHLRPVEAEIVIEGPFTPQNKFTRDQWSACFHSYLHCWSERSHLLKLLAHGVQINPHWQWFQVRAVHGTSGLHAEIETDRSVWDRFVIISEGGTFTSLTLKRAKNAVGVDAESIFLQIIGTLQSTEIQNLASSVDWVSSQVSQINLRAIQTTAERRVRLAEFSRAQMTLASLLSVSPSRPEGFFHFGGLAHMLAMDLLMHPEKSYPSEESFFNYAEPNLRSMLSYLNDFDDKNAANNLQELLEDLIATKQRRGVK